MMLPRRPSVRIRLLSALAFLCLATMLVGAVSWAALDRATSRLETLHRDTLAEVARALTLSQEVSGLATLAPYLLTLDSPFRIRRGGERALASIDRIVADQVGTSIGADLAPLLAAMADGISDLILATETRAQVRDLTLRINAGLAHDERRYAAMGARGDGDLDRRRDWLTLQRLGAALLGAGRAENLIGVGEFQREFHGLSRAMAVDPAVPVAMQAELARLLTLAEGVDGLFDLRRHELAAQIRAESALVGIRLAADDVSALAITVTARAQTDLAAERADTRSTISLAKSLILAVGLGSAAVALGAALYVSGYVTGNLRAISDAMMRLASGDRGSRLPRGEGAGDEIGKLLHAFRAFRANALRLDRSNRQMLQKNALFENMFANIDDGVAILSPAGAVMAANPRLAKVLRVDPETLSGRPDLGAVLTGAGFQVVPGVAGVVALTAPDGAVIERRESALPDGGAVQIYSDVTERRQMDTRLAQIQRIESLGKVTGEVAHDFGNILSTISSSLHLLETAPPERAPALRQSIGSAVDLGAALTQRLLAFARRQHLDPELVDLDALLEGVADLVDFALRDGVEVRVVPSGRDLTVRVDPGQLESAILNLCLNAGQAMEGPGEIRVEASAHGNLAVIEVTDTGCGMSPAVLRHAMEPFYTARRDGTGTGLGLAMVYGFIRQSGGDVQIVSVEGQGTTVRLSLPLWTAPPCAGSAGSVTAWTRVLLIEDDPAAMAAARAALDGPGVDMVACTTESGARDVLAGSARFDLMVTDLHLDGQPAGWDLAETALTTRPALRVIVASGRLPAANPLERYGSRLVAVSKPLTRAVLMTALAVPPHDP